MTYILKSGALRPVGQDNILARIKNDFRGYEKKIYLPDGTLSLYTDIRHLNSSKDCIHDTQYIMCTLQGEQVSAGWPEYSKDENPENHGWPVSHMPKVDHSFITLNSKNYVLNMVSGRLYEMYDNSGKTVMRIKHRGIQGGWYIETFSPFKPDIICGIFSFCRYLEHENEFVVV